MTGCGPDSYAQAGSATGTLRHVLIGTWNLDAKWTPGHAEFLEAQDCDVWLLTEVNPRLEFAGYTLHLTAGTMARGQAWAGVLSRLPARALPEPHPASAAVEIDGHVFCSSVLPWTTCGGEYPWRGANVGEKTSAAVGDLLASLPVGRTVWGGDWNHTLTGALSGSSKVGRATIQHALGDLGLVCPTATLPHRLPGMTSIDHIAIPVDAPLQATRHVQVPPRLSDHDAYVIETSLP